MADIVRVTVKERYDVVLTDAHVSRICQLVIPSLGRGRHDLTLNSVLTGSDKAKDFLVAFIAKRLELEKGPNAPLTYWEQHRRRADVFANAMKRPTRINQDPGRPSPLNHEVVGYPVASASSGILPPSPEPEPQPSIRLTDERVFTAVERWFLVEVDPGYRHAICEESRHQVARYQSRCAGLLKRPVPQ